MAHVGMAYVVVAYEAAVLAYAVMACIVKDLYSYGPMYLWRMQFWHLDRRGVLHNLSKPRLDAANLLLEVHLLQLVMAYL